MADDAGSPQIVAAIKTIAPLAPGIAGAIMSMAWEVQIGGRSLTGLSKLLSLGVGLCGAMWAAPAMVAVLGQVWPWKPMPAEIGAAITLFWGLFGIIVVVTVAGVLPGEIARRLKMIRQPGASNTEGQ